MNRDKMSVQQEFLQRLMDEEAVVNIFLVGGIRLVGKITAFDQYVVELTKDSPQVVIKSAISTIMPAIDSHKPENTGNTRPRREGRQSGRNRSND